METEVKEAIRAAFKQGQLKTYAVDPVTGVVGKHTVTAVLKHHTPNTPTVKVVTQDGRDATFTTDHSLFYRLGDGIVPVQAGVVRSGDRIATVENKQLGSTPVGVTLHLPPEEYTYDLSVPGPENFVLANGIVAHNSYSIGGINLDIEKSSKYESLKQNAESQFDKAAEAKARTVKYQRGLQQPKYGIGIRSSFGAQTGRGVLSPRNFL